MDDNPYSGHVFGLNEEADRLLREQVRQQRLNDAEARERQQAYEWGQHEDLITGLRDGNLAPLASHLRSGLTLPQFVADEIADMIEGNGVFFNIVTKGRKPGQDGWSDKLSFERQRMVIGVFFEGRIRALGRGGFEAALQETMDRFSIGATAAKNHRKWVSDCLDRVGAEGGDIGRAAQDEIFSVWAQVYAADND